MSDTTKTEEKPESPAVLAARKELGLLTNAVYALGECGIKAKEGLRAHEILAYLDALAVKKQDEVNSLIATETLGRPMKMEGSTLSAAEVKS